MLAPQQEENKGGQESKGEDDLEGCVINLNDLNQWYN